MYVATKKENLQQNNAVRFSLLEYLIIAQLQYRHKRFLRNFYRSDHLHAFFSFFLFFQQFTFTCDISTIQFCGDVFSNCLNCGAGSNFISNCSLHRNFKLLSWDQISQPVNNLFPSFMSKITVYNKG